MQDMTQAEKDELVFNVLVVAAYIWATKHMDQWEKFKFKTPGGTLYVTLSHHSDFPADHVPVDHIIVKPPSL